MNQISKTHHRQNYLKFTPVGDENQAQLRFFKMKLTSQVESFSGRPNCQFPCLWLCKRCRTFLHRSFRFSETGPYRLFFRLNFYIKGLLLMTGHEWTYCHCAMLFPCSIQLPFGLSRQIFLLGPLTIGLALIGYYHLYQVDFSLFILCNSLFPIVNEFLYVNIILVILFQLLYYQLWYHVATLKSE